MADSAIVVIGASAGGLTSLRQITESLPTNCQATLFVVVHVGRVRSSVPEILRWHGRLPVSFGADGALIRPGHIHVAPPDQHMTVTAENIELSQGSLVHLTRPAIDPLFISAAEAFGPRVVGVVLSGYGNDGAAGLAAIAKGGGLALAQEPGQAASPGMPQAALAANAPERLPVDAIARRVAEFCSRPIRSPQMS